jgi:CheY-like chemotaxis protein
LVRLQRDVGFPGLDILDLDASTGELPAPRILVVDDDAAIRGLVAEILASEGYRVAVAAHGREALTIAEGAPPSLVMLDMRMPVLDGWGFAREFRSRSEHGVPILVMMAARDAARWAAEIAAEGYLAKPFDLRALVDTVGRLCPGAA